MILIGDDRVKLEIMDLNDSIPVDSRFLIKFYLKAEMVSVYEQPMSLLNESIDCFLKHIEWVNF